MSARAKTSRLSKQAAFEKGALQELGRVVTTRLGPGDYETKVVGVQQQVFFSNNASHARPLVAHGESREKSLHEAFRMAFNPKYKTNRGNLTREVIQNPPVPLEVSFDTPKGKFHVPSHVLIRQRGEEENARRTRARKSTPAV